MDFELLKTQLPSTPAFVLDQQVLKRNLELLAELKQQSGCKILYSIKALPLTTVLQTALITVDGFSVSSLFEARLAHEISAGRGSIHLTTPGLRSNEITEIMQLCTHLSFNSLNQWRYFAKNTTAWATSFGLRVNPKLSFAPDSRFDPCRPESKLGIDSQSLLSNALPSGIEGLHFHTVFSAVDFEPLLKTVALLRTQLGTAFQSLKWLNLGGGYLFDQIADHQPFIELVKRLQQDYAIHVYIEPGKAVVGQAGYLVSSVVDCFMSDGKRLAVLDTSINHHPEVFEYQRQPELFEHQADGEYPVLLTGSTCLAGDVFGEYRFKRALKRFDRVVFPNVGAYTLIKANRFNGYNLPDLYSLEDNRLRLLKQYSYQEYRQQWLV